MPRCNTEAMTLHMAEIATQIALSVQSWRLLERADLKSSACEVQALQTNSYGVKPLKSSRCVAKL